MKKICIILVLFFLSGFYLFGQKEDIELIFQGDNIEKFYFYNTERLFFKDSILIHDHLKKIIQVLYQKGYLEASVDSVIKRKNAQIAYFRIGARYNWGKIDFTSIEESPVSSNRLNLERFQNRPINISNLSDLMEQIIQIFENNGYPFVELTFESITIASDTLSAKLNIRKNGFFKIDSIVISSKEKINHNYLYQYLNLKPGDIYRESKLESINDRLNDLVFIRTTRPTSIEFSAESVDIYFFLDKKKANQFSGILGFQPNTTSNKQLIITGDIAKNRKTRRSEKNIKKPF